MSLYQKFIDLHLSVIALMNQCTTKRLRGLIVATIGSTAPLEPQATTIPTMTVNWVESRIQYFPWQFDFSYK